MPDTADVAVVGGGIMGCAAAAELAAAGADVVLFERAQIASAASGRNHGLIFYPQNEILDALYRASLDRYRHLSESSEVSIALDPSPRGMLIVVASEEEWGAAESEARSSEGGGIEVERLEEPDLYEAEPRLAPGHLGGWLVHDGYRLDPAALTLAFALEAGHSGARIRTHTDVKQIVVREGRATGVVTDEGMCSAGSVLDAAGPWAARLARTAGVELPITGARGWLILTRPAGFEVRHLVESSGWHLTAGQPGPREASVGGYARGEGPAANDVGLLIQQNPTGHILLGGSRLSSVQDEPEGVEVTLEIARRAVATMPALDPIPIAGVWSGVRPMSRDGLPFIGEAPGVGGLFVAGGHGGQGVILGGGSGRLVAQMVLGQEPFTDPKPFSLERG